MHSEQMPPQFLGARRTISYVGKPDLIGPIVTAVRSACPEPSRCYCPYAMMTHEPLDPATACRVPQVAQGHVDSRRAIAAAMGQMKAPNLGEQGAIGCLAWAFGPAAPGIIPRRRDAHHVAQDANR